MKRHFVIPITVAAVAHGVLFAIPRPPMPPRVVEKRIVREAKPMPPTIDVVPYKDDDEQSEVPSGGRSTEVARLDEPLIENDRPGITIQVPTQTPSRLPAIPMDAIPNDFGPGDGSGVGPGVGPGVVLWKGLDRSPNARVQVAPQYPHQARQAGLEGQVTVEFSVDESGNVYGARAISSTDPLFNDAAVRAVQKWKFEPGTVSGRVVRFRMAVPILFRLDS